MRNPEEYPEVNKEWQSPIIVEVETNRLTSGATNSSNELMSYVLLLVHWAMLALGVVNICFGAKAISNCEENADNTTKPSFHTWLIVDGPISIAITLLVTFSVPWLEDLFVGESVTYKRKTMGVQLEMDRQTKTLVSIFIFVLNVFRLAWLVLGSVQFQRKMTDGGCFKDTLYYYGAVILAVEFAYTLLSLLFFRRDLLAVILGIYDFNPRPRYAPVPQQY